MSCHNERINKAKKAKEKETNPSPILEKSLPSLPIEAELEVRFKLHIINIKTKN